MKITHNILPSALLALTIMAVSLGLQAQTSDPTATTYTLAQCQGSLMPYPAVTADLNLPDTLTPVHITYVGRHGSRYPASPTHCRVLENALARADSLGTLTPLGRSLRQLNQEVMALSRDRWGSLDTLGKAEMRGLASRMMARFMPLFKDGALINGLSSYSPRVMMSMYEFTHQMDRLNNRLEFVTSTGRQNSKLCRPFDTPEFTSWLRDGAWQQPYDSIVAASCPIGPITRAVGAKFPWASENERTAVALAEYYILAGCSAMGYSIDPLKYLSLKEYNELWSCFNLRQYLQRTATVMGTAPADIASALLEYIIAVGENVANDEAGSEVDLIMGHAETLMPLLSLMRLPGCYYLTNYYDTVAMHWRDWKVVPMAANLQLVMLRHTANGRMYLLTLLNERPVTLIPGDARQIVPWPEAREYLSRCLPL